MSIIQQIRDKAAWLVFGLIALSLVGFLLMDAFVGRSRLFGGNSNIVGSVDGEKLDYTQFQRQVSEREEGYKAQGYPMNEMMQQNIRESVWKQFVEDVLLDKVYKQSGIEVSDKELNDLLVGPDAVPDIKRSFTDPKTGIFDAQAAASTINQLRSIYKGNKKSDKNYEQARRFFEEGIPQIVESRERTKYLSLIANSAYVPKWMVEKSNADNSQIASIRYVNAPYSGIPDSLARVSDDEITDYVNKHKDQYKQDEMRSISYVSFSAAPTAGDSANIRQQVLNLKPDFIKTNDAPGFIARNGSEISFFDGYLSRTKLQIPFKDSILALPKGGVFGPYQDSYDYVLAKMIDIKTMPDSVRARHILVSFNDPATGQPILDDSSARHKIDSIKSLIDHGARFDSTAARLSDDGSKLKGGDLGYFTPEKMVKEFSDFCFNGKTGDRKIVKTQFGYHYIEITDQKSFEPAYKIAYMARKIEASPETDQNASGLANQFAGESRDRKSFEENARKGNLTILPAPDILPTDFNIQGLGSSRQLVRWVYDGSVGDVSEPFNIEDKYVVALVTEVNPEGTMKAAKARPAVEPILRNQKKADMIIKKIGNAATLEAMASATGNTVKTADSISFSTPYIPNLGQEGKVVGLAFDKDLAGKQASPLVPGNGGVFMIQVEKVIAKPSFNADVAQAKKTQEQMQASIFQRQAIDALRKDATIKDNRGKYY